MLTPFYISRTMVAGASAVITQYGRHIIIVSVSASSVALSIGEDSPQLIAAGEHIDCEDRKYNRLVLTNTGVVACTVVMLLSDTLVDMQSSGGVLSAIAASLVTINQQTAGAAAAAVAGQLADTICPISPGPAQLLFAANPLRTEIEITAPRTNGAGLIYLGITAARSTTVDKFGVLSAGEPWSSLREKGAIYACSSTGAEIVNGREC